MEILFNNKKEQTVDTFGDLHEYSEDYAGWKKPILKGYIVNNSI